jgi:superfamily I DNA/RNA helicase
VVPVSLQKTKSNIADSIAHDREERRNLYVAMTRAKELLILTYHIEDVKRKSRSKFLNDIKLKTQNYE